MGFARIGHDITVLQIRDRFMALSGLHILGTPSQAMKRSEAYGFCSSDLHMNSCLLNLC